jgi:hypothetical protein
MIASTTSTDLAPASRYEVGQLFNYLDSLQEYLEDQLPETKSALQAVDSLRGFIKNIHVGHPMSGTELDHIVTESHAAFVKAGVISEFTVPCSPLQELSIPALCISKLYEGMTRLRQSAT